MPTSGVSTRRRSDGSRPSTSGSATASTPCISTSSTGAWTPLSSTRCRAEWRAEQNRCLREIERHEAAEQSYMDEGVQILELAQNAQRLFEQQEPREKRRLLNFVLSNCTWEDGEVVATFRQPFDMLAETVTTIRSDTPSKSGFSGETEKYSLGVNRYHSIRDNAESPCILLQKRSYDVR